METTTTPARKTPILVNRNFAWLWTGQAISIFGDLVFETAMVLWIATAMAAGQPWAPLAVSGVLTATSIPLLVIRPFAGVFADRWDKRKTMLSMDAMRAMLIALLVLATGSVALPVMPSGHLPVVWQLVAIYSIVLLASTCTQFFNPSRLALTGDVVAEPKRGRAFGLDYVTENIAVMAGPPLAVLIFFSIGVQWTLWLNALSFAASFLCVQRVRPPHAASSLGQGMPGHVLRELGTGLRFFVDNRILLTVTITLCIVMLGFGSINTLNIFFLSQNLHAATSLYGFLAMASGLGSIAGAALAALYVDLLGASRTYWLAIVIISMALLVYARLTSFVPALVVYFLAGFPQAAVNVAEGALILRVTPREFVGRVSSILQPAITLASLLSAAIAGMLASTLLDNLHVSLFGFTIGPIDTIFTGAGILGLLGGLYAMHNLRSPPPAQEQAEAAPKAPPEASLHPIII